MPNLVSKCEALSMMAKSLVDPNPGTLTGLFQVEAKAIDWYWERLFADLCHRLRNPKDVNGWRDSQQLRQAVG
jgi:hypothetical protein